MTNLLFEQVKISGFRLFKNLYVERLGRVNLIVGKNNVGKSSFLEALRLYAHKGSPAIIAELLTTRDQAVRQSMRLIEPEEVETLVQAIRSLFYKYGDVPDDKNIILIEARGKQQESLKVAINWYQQIEVEERSAFQVVSSNDADWLEDVTLRLTIQVGEHPSISLPLDLYRARRSILSMNRPEFDEIPVVFDPVSGLTNSQIGELWDDIALTKLEEDVLRALRLLERDVERIALVEQQVQRSPRTPIVKLQGMAIPIRLRSMGDGMIRVLSMALALVSARGGLLLIDEFENGLHYSIQANLWKLVLDLATRLDVQVFATSHSWDCIEAFQQATSENSAEMGMLIRLEKHKEEIFATTFDEHELSIATRNEIEVR
jgi:predicted ATPase